MSHPEAKPASLFSQRTTAIWRYRPALLTCLQTYRRGDLKADLFAGAYVAFVALPLCVAFAIAAGAPPETGLYTSIFGGFITGIMGGSRYQVSGPTAAFVAILAPICLQKGLLGLMVAGAMSGVILIIMGLSGLGALIKYVPYPVTTGFTTGIAILIATSSLKDLLGLDVRYEHVREVTQVVFMDGHRGLLTTSDVETVASMPLHYHDKLFALWSAVGQTSGDRVFHSACIGFFALGLLFGYPRYLPRVSKIAPAPFMALVAAAVAAFLLREHLGWRDIPCLSEFPRGLPSINWALFTDFNWSYGNLQSLVLPATIIALLGAMTSLMSAVVSDGLAGTRHDSNYELIGQGAGNIVAPLFGGIACCGAIARTICNINNGARTPMATVFHSLLLAVIVLLFAPVAVYVPHAALAAILMHVAFNMANFPMLRRLLHAPFSDVFVLLNCLLLTVFIDMATAVMVGMILAAMLFMKRMAELTSVDTLQSVSADAEMQSHAISPQDVPRGVTIYSVDGPFFFGASEKAITAMETLQANTRIVVMRLNRVPVMDATGLFALEKVHAYLARRKVHLVVSGVRAQPRELMQKAGFLEVIKPENVTPDIEWAMVRCYELLGPDAKNRPSGSTRIGVAPSRPA